MILMTACLIASASAGVVAAIKVSSRKEVRIAVSRASRADVAQQINELAIVTVAELERMLKITGPYNSDELARVNQDIRKMIRATWSPHVFYWGHAVAPFLRAFDSAAQMEKSNPSDAYVRLLRHMVIQIRPHCCTLILKGDNGDNVTDSAYQAGKTFKELARDLDSHFNTAFERKSRTSRRWETR